MAYTTVRDIDAQIAKLKAERKAAVARERAADAEGARIARDKIGALVLGFFPGGWRTVDFDSLAERFADNPQLFKPTDPMQLDDAMRSWKKADHRKSLKAIEAEKNPVVEASSAHQLADL